jgi:hypothetical protein
MGQSDAPSWTDTSLARLLFDHEPLIRTFAILEPTVWSRSGGSLTAEANHFGLECFSLFQGAAETAIADNSPYIIDLTLIDGENEFQRLFLEERWDENFGIIFLSTATIHDLRKSFRKITKVKDTDGKWYFHRFWEPEYFLYFCNFLYGSRLFQSLSLVQRFIVQIQGSAVVIAPDWARPITMNEDDARERLFDASTAMVGLRHVRRLNETHARDVDVDDVYEEAKHRFASSGGDYSLFARFLDTVFCLFAAYGNDWQIHVSEFLDKIWLDGDDSAERNIHFLSDKCMFALKNDVLPHQLN